MSANKIVEHYSKFQNCIVCGAQFTNHPYDGSCRHGKDKHFLYTLYSATNLQIIRNEIILQYYSNKIIVGVINGLDADKVFDLDIDVEEILFKDQEHLNSFFDRLEKNISLS
jgi:hypothetical protein